MCTFFTIITENNITKDVVDFYKTKEIFINNITEGLPNRISNKKYFLITNGHCSCGFLNNTYIDTFIDLFTDCVRNTNIIFIPYDDNGTIDLNSKLQMLSQNANKEVFSLKDFNVSFPNDIKLNTIYYVYKTLDNKEKVDLIYKFISCNTISKKNSLIWLEKIDVHVEEYISYYKYNKDYPQNYKDEFFEYFFEMGYCISLHELIIQIILLSSILEFSPPISTVDFIALLTNIVPTFSNDNNKMQKITNKNSELLSFFADFKEVYAARGE